MERLVLGNSLGDLPVLGHINRKKRKDMVAGTVTPEIQVRNWNQAVIIFPPTADPSPPLPPHPPTPDAQ